MTEIDPKVHDGEDNATGANSGNHRANDMLPPVEPPAASFIMQLFVVPLVIVAAIVGVWMLFSWLASANSQPAELAVQIDGMNHASWQKALTLANSLQDPRFEEVRRDPELAATLVEALEAQLESEAFDNDYLALRIYLCRALGELEIPDGLPVLLRAAKQENRREDVGTRRAAVQAIGMLVDRIGQEEALKNSEFLPTILEISREPDEEVPADQPQPMATDVASKHRLRSTAAFVLGLVEEPQASERLLEMLQDPNQDVRFNAATSLARQGDVRSLEPLVAMLATPRDSFKNELDPDLTETQRQEWLAFKQELVASTAMRALGALRERGISIDSESLRARLNDIAESPAASEALVDQAQKLGESLNSTS